MPIERENLRSLLAEAKEMLLGLGEAECYEHECGVCGPIDELTARIDAVLKAPISTLLDDAQWKRRPGSRTREELFDNGTYFLSVRKHRRAKAPMPWEWCADDATKELAAGYANTIEEAKSAALQAAATEAERKVQMNTHKPCSAQCESRPPTNDELREALEQMVKALEAHPDLATRVAVMLRLAADQRGR